MCQKSHEVWNGLFSLIGLKNYPPVLILPKTGGGFKREVWERL